MDNTYSIIRGCSRYYLRDKKGGWYNVRLTEEDVKRMVKNSQSGDDKSLLQLYQAFSFFRKGLLSFYSGKGVDEGDIKQELDLAFISSVLDYDTKKHDSAILHIVSKTRRILWGYYRAELVYKKRNRFFSGECPWSDLVDYFDVNEDMLDLKVIARNLSTLEREVLFYHLYLGYTQQETAELLGVSQSTIHRKKNLIKNKINLQKDE